MQLSLLNYRLWPVYWLFVPKGFNAWGGGGHPQSMNKSGAFFQILINARWGNTCYWLIAGSFQLHCIFRKSGLMSFVKKYGDAVLQILPPRTDSIQNSSHRCFQNKTMKLLTSSSTNTCFNTTTTTPLVSVHTLNYLCWDLRGRPCVGLLSFLRSAGLWCEMIALVTVLWTVEASPCVHTAVIPYLTVYWDRSCLSSSFSIHLRPPRGRQISRHTWNLDKQEFVCTFR